jgi:hypothetical protein
MFEEAIGVIKGMGSDEERLLSLKDVEAEIKIEVLNRQVRIMLKDVEGQKRAIFYRKLSSIYESLAPTEERRMGLEALLREIEEVKLKKDGQETPPPSHAVPETISETLKEEKEFTRKAADITLLKITDFGELNALTEQEGDEKFKAKTRELWKQFAVHGIMRKDKETGEFILANHTDLDGKIALGLLEKAGINISDLKYLQPGEYEPGRINLDTGGKDGLNIFDDGTVIIDHHGDESAEDSSATAYVYKTLTSLGLLENEEYLKKMTDFVTGEDNRTLGMAKQYFPYSYKNLYGLSRFVNSKNLEQFFKDGKEPGQALIEKDLKKYGFITEQEIEAKNLWKIKKQAEKILGRKVGKMQFTGEEYARLNINNIYKQKGGGNWVVKTDRSAEQKEAIDKSLAAMEQMNQEGYIIDSEKYGKIAINVGKHIPLNDVVSYSDCDVYIIFSPETDSFFIATQKPFGSDFVLSQGKMVRKKMWIKSRGGADKLTVTLKEILDQLTDGKFSSEGKLKEYLDQQTLAAESEKEAELSPEEAGKLFESLEVLEVLLPQVPEEKRRKYEEKIQAIKNILKEFIQ